MRTASGQWAPWLPAWQHCTRKTRRVQLLVSGVPGSLPGSTARSRRGAHSFWSAGSLAPCLAALCTEDAMRTASGQRVPGSLPGSTAHGRRGTCSFCSAGSLAPCLAALCTEDAARAASGQRGPWLPAWQRCAQKTRHVQRLVSGVPGSLPGSTARSRRGACSLWLAGAVALPACAAHSRRGARSLPPGCLSSSSAPCFQPWPLLTKVMHAHGHVPQGRRCRRAARVPHGRHCTPGGSARGKRPAAVRQRSGRHEQAAGRARRLVHMRRR